MVRTTSTATKKKVVKEKKAKKTYVKKTAKKKVAKKKKSAIVVSMQAHKRETSTKTTGNYVTKSELMVAFYESRERGHMTDSLARKLDVLVTRYSKKAQWAKYTYLDDMKQYAMMMLVRTWKAFMPEKSNNPFAFYTQCIKNSFIQYLNQEKRQRTIKDELLIDSGLSPSYSYQSDYSESSNDGVDMEQTRIPTDFIMDWEDGSGEDH